jgi:hypothetical protein
MISPEMMLNCSANTTNRTTMVYFEYSTSNIILHSNSTFKFNIQIQYSNSTSI